MTRAGDDVNITTRLVRICDFVGMSPVLADIRPRSADGKLEPPWPVDEPQLAIIQIENGHDGGFTINYRDWWAYDPADGKVKIRQKKADFTRNGAARLMLLEAEGQTPERLLEKLEVLLDQPGYRWPY